MKRNRISPVDPVMYGVLTSTRHKKLRDDQSFSTVETYALIKEKSCGQNEVVIDDWLRLKLSDWTWNEELDEHTGLQEQALLSHVTGSSEQPASCSESSHCSSFPRRLSLKHI